MFASVHRGAAHCTAHIAIARCPPCRKFTPVLADIYRQAKAAALPFEIVFVSCDHDVNEFNGYYASHPAWLAVAFDDPLREQLSTKFSVTGVPRLAVLAPTGQILVDNAVQSASLASVRAWVSQAGLL